LAALLAGNIAGPVIVLAWAAGTRLPWSELGFVRWPHWVRDTTIALAGGALLKMLIKIVVLPPLGAPPINAAYHFLAGNSRALPGLILTVVVAAGVGEEIVWRGFLVERLRAALGDAPRGRIAIVGISSVLFGLAHLHDQGWPGALQATMTGAVFGTIFIRRRCIWPVMVAHAAFDLTAILMIYWNREEWFARLLWR
jgi:membrane protease YdiL (CAAX protease family)